MRSIKYVESVVSFSSDEELCERILTLVKNPELRSSMGKIGRDTVVKDNNSKVEVKKVVDLFQRVSQSYRKLNSGI